MLSEWDKAKTAEAFQVPAGENQDCMILVATDAYSVDIDNPDISLVV